ncbi:hypothetical protein ISCGN_022165 [Ixodes scapularis]
MTPRAVPEQGTPLSAATAEPEAKSEPQSTARSYADFPKLKTPPRVGDAIAFKVLELDANYCPNVSGYKEGKVLHHNTRTDMLRIELRVPEVKATYNGKFELEVPEEDEAPPVEETCSLDMLWHSSAVKFRAYAKCLTMIECGEESSLALRAENQNGLMEG